MWTRNPASNSSIRKEGVFRFMLPVAEKQMPGANLSNCHSCRRAAAFISRSHFVEVANIYACTHRCTRACGSLCGRGCDQVLLWPIVILKRKKIIVMLNKSLANNQYSRVFSSCKLTILLQQWCRKRTAARTKSAHFGWKGFHDECSRKYYIKHLNNKTNLQPE